MKTIDVSFSFTCELPENTNLEQLEGFTTLNGELQLHEYRDGVPVMIASTNPATAHDFGVALMSDMATQVSEIEFEEKLE